METRHAHVVLRVAVVDALPPGVDNLALVEILNLLKVLGRRLRTLLEARPREPEAVLVIMLTLATDLVLRGAVVHALLLCSRL
jgi:hypothetical protein